MVDARTKADAGFWLMPTGPALRVLIADDEPDQLGLLTGG